MGKEITRVHQNKLEEQDILEERLEAVKEAEKERVRHKSRAPVILVIDVDPSLAEKAE